MLRAIATCTAMSNHDWRFAIDGVEFRCGKNCRILGRSDFRTSNAIANDIACPWEVGEVAIDSQINELTVFRFGIVIVIRSKETTFVAEGVGMDKQAFSMGIVDQATGRKSNAIGIIDCPVIIQVISLTVVVGIHVLDGNDHPFPRTNSLGILSNFG